MPRVQVALLSSIFLSYHVVSGISSNSPSRTHPGVAFCAPLSPRCFSTKRRAIANAAASDSTLTPPETATISRGPSLDAPLSVEVGGVSTPRKHLGPTAEEIVEQRKQEALQRKSEFFSSFSPAEESAESGIDAYTRPSSIGVTSGSGGRHLGPTLDEVAELRLSRNAPSAATGSGSKKVGKMLGASGKFELIAGGPSREQIHALLNLGVTEMPKTKEEASSLIRELRDYQIAQRLGMQEMKKDGVVLGGQSPEPSAAAQPAHAPGAGPQEHLHMALRGLNMITRR